MQVQSPSESTGRTCPRPATVLAATALVTAAFTGENPDPTATVEALVAGLVHEVPGARWASITQPHGTNRFQTVAASDDVARRVDEAQYELGDGPCLRAVHGAAVVASEATLSALWPELSGRMVTDTPARSVLSLPLGSAPHVGSLNIYSDRSDGFEQSAVAAAARLAVVCGLALAAVHQQRRADNLAAALQSSRRIGAATGIVMAMHRCPYDEAFEMLRNVSQRTHRKLRDVADEVLFTGALPDL